jgi:hypothetical protein
VVVVPAATVVVVAVVMAVAMVAVATAAVAVAVDAVADSPERGHDGNAEPIRWQRDPCCCGRLAARCCAAIGLPAFLRSSVALRAWQPSPKTAAQYRGK